MSLKKSKTPDFKQSLELLEKLVNKMESGELPLEQSLKHFEEGIVLIRQCQKMLSDAEQKVALLTEAGNLVSYETDNE